MNRTAVATSVGLAFALACCCASADEGMWTIDHFPVAKVEHAYGVKIDQKWLDRVQAASVRFTNSCSASLVSGDGLVFSAHHCVASCIQSLSTAQTDFMKDGFSAAVREEERKCPGIQAEILLSVDDVTDRVKQSASGKSGAAFAEARDAAVASIEKAGCTGDPTSRCEVVSLYGGGQFRLYRYRQYSDVRLVFAPESSVASFGGDPDNFNFPRYGFDISFVRLYENGKPVKTPRHLVWQSRAPRVGEPTFLSGFPKSTNRMLTAAQLETQRDVRLPIAQIQFAELRGRMIRFAEESAEHRRVSADPLFNVENYLKYLGAGQLVLNDKTLLDAKRAEEAELKARIAADPRLGAEIGDPWSAVTNAQVAYADNYLRFRMLEGGSQSSLYAFALMLVRAAQERTKPAAERLPEYSDSRLARVESELLDESPVNPDLEQLYLEFWLSKTRESLSADDRTVQLLLGKDSPEELAAKLVKDSKLADVAARKALWDGGFKAVQASDDPMIRLALRLDPAARAVRKVWEADVTGPTDAAAGRIARARFAVYGDEVYPNGTSSLRLSYGKVAGWTSQGRTVAPFTTISGLYERATGAEPFHLPPRWIAARDRLTPGTVLNFIITNDGAPGNSGSPVFNAAGEILGVEFDGNLYAAGGEYGYNGLVNRLIAVSTSVISEALEKVYGQQSLVRELRSSSVAGGN